ncbi:citrate synthase [Boeremia exigua]|uniref:citrate synthase n=1 Tax=Boeremia exigua TaxID=749465 RepID=UPI001E8D87B1|nr:citrate synthase [Boeremia exigua]KAH6625778.1 citrate synthase [Boeremia exigua]
MTGFFLYLFELICSIPTPSWDTLWVWDLRTFRPYSIAIKHNAIDAMQFRKISPLSMTAPVIDHLSAGLTVLDEGYKNTAVVKSQITHIDGNKGTLAYRGYPVGYLFENHDYEEVSYLLIFGDLPTPEQKRNFRANLAEAMVPEPSVMRAVRAFDPAAPAYLIISAGLSAWAAADPSKIPVHAGDRIYLGNMEAVDDGVYRSLAALATVTAMTSCHQQKKTFFVQSDPALSLIDNMLIMMGHTDRFGNVDKKYSNTVNKLWVLFADHEMTNSTAAYLHAASSLSDPISSMVTGISACAGPLHAGAIDLAYKRFAEIRGTDGGVKKHIEDVKAKKFRLMGVGHRVYRTVDPRVGYLREMMSKFSNEVNGNPLLEVAKEIENAVFNDDYFLSRKLSINADLYGSFVYAALGFDVRIFTPLAITARSAGILGHWRESMQTQPCLWRPRQIYTGTAPVGA